jgi:hypothetical protein
MVKMAADPKLFQQSYVPVAFLLEGKFRSLYVNRLQNVNKDSLAGVSRQPFLSSAEKTARIIVCADGDLVMNDLDERGRPLPLGFSKDINYTFANAELLSNFIEYCVNPNGILEARSKDYSLRLLDPEKTEDDRSFWQSSLACLWGLF